MKLASLAAVTVILSAVAAFADEIKVDSPIESVAMFKNGLAVVRRSVAVSGPGVYLIEDPPAAVHGTFWVEGDIPVDVQSTLRDEEVPAGTPGDPQTELVGRTVVIHFKQAGSSDVGGTVVALARPKGEAAWDRTYGPPNYYDNNGIVPSAGQYLVLDSSRGGTYISSSEIATMEVVGADATVHQRRGVLLLTSTGVLNGTIHISYLAKGMAWAPSYRVELLDDKKLSLKQQAVVKDELADFHDAELTLISGYPSIKFAQVVSPLSPTQTWANFFQQLSGGPNEMGGIASNSIMMQAANNGRAPGTAIDLPGAPTGEGTDLHYQSIGKRTLAEGDSLLTQVEAGDASYDRVVQWTIPDTRNEFGFDRNTQDRDPNNFAQIAEQNQPWDAIRFKNPLPFAMTTGPAEIVDGGQFAGQTLSEWVNSGEETTLQITKALSIRARASETQTDIGGHGGILSSSAPYPAKYDVNGQLVINNDRNREINLVIHRQFSGVLVKADENPAVTLRADAPLATNPRNDMVWKLTLKPGEEKKLSYEYTLAIGQ